MEFNLKDYHSRQDLEQVILAEVGNDIKMNRDAGHSILGTKEEFKNFSLDDTSNIFGVRCIFKDVKDSSKERLKIKNK